jgi:Xaa-Pro dipeptidase
MAFLTSHYQIIMERRNFIKTTAVAGSLAVLAPSVAFGQQTEKNFSEGEIHAIRNRIIPIIKEERDERIENARRLMRDNNIDAMLIEGGTSLVYFTGIQWWRSERLFAMILTQKGEPFYISPKFEEGRAQEQTGNAKIYTWQEDESPYAILLDALKQNNLSASNFAIEESTRFFIAESLHNAAPQLHIVNANAVTAGCRSVKTEHEVELMKVANDITIKVFRSAFKSLKEGMTQNELADIISKRFSEFGVEGGALALIGKGSAYPHGVREEIKLKEGDIVLLDGGCTVEGYESDVTRTSVFGKPSDKMKSVWDIVRKAQDAGLRTARKGVPAENIDAAARKVITDAGYGPGFKYFTHRLGHGIGMDGHEWYYLVPGNKRPVQPGNMFSNEPGIYIPGEFGIRLEDEMLITETGASLLLTQQESIEKV